MVANVIGVKATVIGDDKVVTVVAVKKTKLNLELMAITNKEDFVELYVLMLCNPNIYPNKDHEEGDGLKGW